MKKIVPASVITAFLLMVSLFGFSQQEYYNVPDWVSEKGNGLLKKTCIHHGNAPSFFITMPTRWLAQKKSQVSGSN